MAPMVGGLVLAHFLSKQLEQSDVYPNQRHQTEAVLLVAEADQAA